MEVELAPSAERRLRKMIADANRTAGEIVEDALAGYHREVSLTRRLLNRRYDELQSGAVAALSLEQVADDLRRKSVARRRRS